MANKLARLRAIILSLKHPVRQFVPKSARFQVNKAVKGMKDYIGVDQIGQLRDFKKIKKMGRTFGQYGYYINPRNVINRKYPIFDEYGVAVDLPMKDRIKKIKTRPVNVGKVQHVVRRVVQETSVRPVKVALAAGTAAVSVPIIKYRKKATENYRRRNKGKVERRAKQLIREGLV